MECSTDPSTSATPCIKQDPIDNLINNNNQRLFPSSHNPFMMNNVDLQQSSELNSSCFNNLFAEIGSQYSQHIPTMNNSMPEVRLLLIIFILNKKKYMCNMSLKIDNNPRCICDIQI